MTAIAPATVRYIKLGANGRWARRCFENGEMHFGYKTVPHVLCLAGDWDAVARLIADQDGKSAGKARDAAREIRDFYTLGADCLWITIDEGRLWWTFAAPEVAWLGGDEGQATRMRKTIGGWRSTSLDGEPLRLDTLSTRLTQVAAYRQTICAVKEEAYLLRRINGIEEPVLTDARHARAAMTLVAGAMIANLHWADFETLVDLIFARSGWQRVSRVGETMADVDLVLQQPATGETAFVQVKSKAGQPVLDDYVGRFRQSDIYDRMFFVCHSPLGTLTTAGATDLHLWAGDKLADAAVKAGLFDWLMERSA